MQRPIKPLAEIAPAEIAHRLRAQPDSLGDPRWTHSLIQQAQHLSPLDHPYRPDAAPQHRRNPAPVGRLEPNHQLPLRAALPHRARAAQSPASRQNQPLHCQRTSYNATGQETQSITYERRSEGLIQRW
jgi:hypothetical protein